MIAILELLALLLVASAIGRTAIRILGLSVTSRLERFAYSTPIGLGVLAYTVLVLGLSGLLSIVPVCISLAALSIANWKGFSEVINDLKPQSSQSSNLESVPLDLPALEIPE